MIFHSSVQLPESKAYSHKKHHKNPVKVPWSILVLQHLWQLPSHEFPSLMSSTHGAHGASGLVFSPLASARTGTFRGGVALLTSDRTNATTAQKNRWAGKSPVKWRFQWEMPGKSSIELYIYIYIIYIYIYLSIYLSISLNICDLYLFSASHVWWHRKASAAW